MNEATQKQLAEIDFVPHAEPPNSPSVDVEENAKVIVEKLLLELYKNPTSDRTFEYYCRNTTNAKHRNAATHYQNFLREQGAIVRYGGVDDDVKSEFSQLQRALNGQELGYNLPPIGSWQVKVAQEGVGYDVVPSPGAGALPVGAEPLRLPPDSLPQSIAERAPRGMALEESTKAYYDAWFAGLSKSMKDAYPGGVTGLYKLGTRVGALAMEMIGKVSIPDNVKMLFDWNRLGVLTDDHLVAYYCDKIENRSSKAAAKHYQNFLRKQGAIIRYGGVDDDVNSEFFQLQRALNAQEPGYALRSISSWQVKVAQAGEGYDVVPSPGAGALPVGVKAIRLLPDSLPQSIAERAPRGMALKESTKAHYDAWRDGLSKSMKNTYPGGVTGLYQLGARIEALSIEMIGQLNKITNNEMLFEWTRRGVLTDDHLVAYYCDITGNKYRKDAAKHYQNFLREQGAIVRYGGVDDDVNSEFFQLQRALNAQEPGYALGSISSWQVKVAQAGAGYDVVPSPGAGALPVGVEAIRLLPDSLPQSIAERAPRGMAFAESTKAHYDAWYDGLSIERKEHYPNGVSGLYELGTDAGALTMEMIGQTRDKKGKKRAGDHDDGRGGAPIAPGPTVRFAMSSDGIDELKLDNGKLSEAYISLASKAWIHDYCMTKLSTGYNNHNEKVLAADGQADVYFFSPELTALALDMNQGEGAVQFGDNQNADVLNMLLQKKVVFCINHGNNHWAYAGCNRDTGEIDYRDPMQYNLHSEEHEDLGHFEQVKGALKNLYALDRYWSPNRPRQPLLRKCEVPQQTNDTDCGLYLCSWMAQDQDRRNGVNVDSRLEDSVPFARETLQKDIAFTMLCNEVNFVHSTLQLRVLPERIDPYTCTYEIHPLFDMERGINKYFLAIIDNSERGRAVLGPMGDALRLSEEYIEEADLGFTINDFVRFDESKDPSAKRSKTSDYATSYSYDSVGMGDTTSSTGYAHSSQDSSRGIRPWLAFQQSQQYGFGVPPQRTKASAQPSADLVLEYNQELRAWVDQDGNRREFQPALEQPPPAEASSSFQPSLEPNLLSTQPPAFQFGGFPPVSELSSQFGVDPTGAGPFQLSHGGPANAFADQMSFQSQREMQNPQMGELQPPRDSNAASEGMHSYLPQATFPAPSEQLPVMQPPGSRLPEPGRLPSSLGGLERTAARPPTMRPENTIRIERPRPPDSRMGR